MAPDEEGSAMPLCVSGEVVFVSTKKGRTWFDRTYVVYNKPTGKNKDFIVGYPCVICNHEQIRKVFSARAKTEHKNNPAARGQQTFSSETKSIDTDRHGLPTVGLVGSHSWITTGYCSCDNKFYCYNCFPKHVEDKWNEANPMRQVNVTSNHEIQIVKGATVKCAGSCGRKFYGTRQCSCQVGSTRFCESCYADHCISCLKKEINENSDRGNQKKDEDYDN